MTVAIKHLKARAERKGAILIVKPDSAELIAPAGKTFEGYHSTVDYFDDGKATTWAIFNGYLNNLVDCEYENCCQAPAKQATIKFVIGQVLTSEWDSGELHIGGTHASSAMEVAPYIRVRDMFENRYDLGKPASKLTIEFPIEEAHELASWANYYATMTGWDYDEQPHICQAAKRLLAQLTKQGYRWNGKSIEAL
jgi:hypothetical protein